MSVGKIIKECRIKEGWTQKELAERTGMKQQQIALYESGKAFPRDKTLQRLSDTFCVHLGCFTDRTMATSSDRELFLKLLDIAIEMTEITDKSGSVYPFATVDYSGGPYYFRLYRSYEDVGLFSTLQMEIYQPFYMALDAAEKALNELKEV